MRGALLALIGAVALMGASGCDEGTIVRAKPGNLHPEGCGKHGPAIASRGQRYVHDAEYAKDLVFTEKYTGTLVTCNDGVTVLVP